MWMIKLKEEKLMNECKMKVAIYSRVGKLEEGDIITRNFHLDVLKNYALNNNMEIVAEYFEVGSGNAKKRPVFNNLIEDAKSGKFEYIIAKDMSRIGRNTLNALSIIRKLKEEGVGFKTISDGFDSMQEDSDIKLTIMYSIAEMESKNLSDRIKFGKKLAKARREHGV
jgi:DNA invertase Pin-like site-specific DNA recombinase